MCSLLSLFSPLPPVQFFWLREVWVRADPVADAPGKVLQVASLASRLDLSVRDVESGFVGAIRPLRAPSIDTSAVSSGWFSVGNAAREKGVEQLSAPHHVSSSGLGGDMHERAFAEFDWLNGTLLTNLELLD